MPSWFRRPPPRAAERLTDPRPSYGEWAILPSGLCSQGGARAMAVTLPAPGTRARPTSAYARLEERILSRDQRGASKVFFQLVKDRRPLAELLREAVRIHGPYTHVPYHQRLDDGVVKFVNNDHCLLSARATLRLTE